MKADAALVRADGAVKLYAVAAVHVNFARIVRPRNAEYNGTFGLYAAFQNCIFFEFRHFFGDDFKRFQHFMNGL